LWRFVSHKASVNTPFLGSLIRIYGRTVVSSNTIVDDMVVLGYPTRKNLAKVLEMRVRPQDLDQAFDKVSEGCIIGESCMIRSGCIIYERVKIGNRVQLGHNVLVREDTEIGDGSSIGSYTIIEGEACIGSQVNVQSNVFIPRRTVVEDDVFLGPGVVITNDKYPPSGKIVMTRICKGAIIAANAVIIAGVKVGPNSFVAAGSVVTKDVPEGVAVRGSPAKPFSEMGDFLRKREEYLKSI